jgi:hypothetical protein
MWDTSDFPRQDARKYVRPIRLDAVHSPLQEPAHVLLAVHNPDMDGQVQAMRLGHEAWCDDPDSVPDLRHL